MAACTHYFWLVSFSWMAVIAFDVCRVFARSIYIPSTRFDTALFAVYSLIGWGLPVVIVGVAVLVDNCNCTDFEVGYGEGEYCWIHDQTAFVTFFLTPVATAIVFNIVCFCVAFFSVHYNVMRTTETSKTSPSPPASGS
ncbi:adhesion G-protein coupled receptor G7-like [Ptychodera flava]|uniref:adhesion G-protein coupled receptor G7-like n=1 Tax=Ptychodera flava TaxID=63121 RepID=UPI00396A7CA1